MARRLPWKQKQGKPTPKPEAKRTPSRPGASPGAARASPSPKPGRRRLDESSGEALRRPAGEAERQPGLTAAREPPGPFGSLRSPSTSPPPEPPAEEPMIPADDRYRMVEDEFLHTAQRFTKHLHRAEYNRLKARAKTQHALTIRAIERPVVGPPTATARLRDAVSKRAARQRNLLTPRRARQAATDDDDDDADAPWVGTSLQGLMETPQRDARSISSCAPVVHPTTSAAAAAGPAPRRRAHHFASPPPPERRRPAAAAADHPTFRADAPSRGGGVSDVATRDCDCARDSARDKGDAANIAWQAGAGEEDATDDDDPFSISRRRMRRERSRAQLRKTGDRDPPRRLSPDTIPSFL